MNNNATATTYTIPLKQQANSRTVNTTSLLMVAISLIAFMYRAVNQQQTFIAACFGALLLISLYWLYSTFRNKPSVAYLHIVLILVALYWFVLGGMAGNFVGIVLIVAAIFEQLLKRKPAITIDATGVTLKTPFTTTLPWSQLSNVIIKDGLVTIDAKNNKIWQKEATEDLSADDEKVINGYCSAHLS